MSYNDTYFSSNENKAINSEENISSTESNNISNEQTYSISFYHNEYDNKPKAKLVSWSSFCKTFSIHTKRTDKMRAPCWTPASYEPNKTRHAVNVLNVSMIVVDVDNGLPVNQVTDKLIGLTYLIHSSYSHTRDKAKYRVILPLSTPVEANEWAHTWLRINQWLGGINDPATKDPCRIYFLPACPLDSNDQFVISKNGVYLDINKLPELPFEAIARGINNSSVNYRKIDGIELTPQDALGSEEQLVEMTNRCSFIQWSANPTNQPGVIEPLWLGMLSNQCRFEGGREVAHKSSSEHPEYDENATDRKLERCLQGSAPITCNRIQELGFTGCPSGGCKLPSGITTKSPAGLGIWANKKNEGQDLNQANESNRFPSIVQSYITEHHSGKLTFVNGSFYSYQEGYWPRLNEQVDIRKKIALKFGRDATPKSINELHSLCKDFCAAGEQDVTPNLNLICLQNGTLDVENAKLIEFSPEHHLKYKSNISWDADAKCERWLRFLDEIFETDADKLEKIAFIKTWFGYCLVPDTTQHKFVWMIGAGGNGKSVLLSLLTKLIGSSNVSDLHIESLGDKYVRAELIGKLVNISAEMSANATLADGYFKQIVSGEPIPAERKYQDPFSFKPFVRLIGATNHLPRLQDLSDGFFRRAIILSFNRKFIGVDCDPTLEATLTSELPGILTWAVEGLKELRSVGKFVMPPSSIEALQQYKVESDPVALFAASCLQFSDGERMSPSEVYEGFKKWANINGYSIFNIVNFGKRLVALDVKQSRPGGYKKWHVKPVNADGFEWPHSMAISHEKVAFLTSARFTEMSKKYSL